MKKSLLTETTRMDRVVAEARRLFVVNGYHRVSIPAIVRASGVSTGAIYHYFANKEALARYIHERTLGDFQRLFSERIEDERCTFGRLRAFADLVFELTESDREMMEYMLALKHDEFLPGSLPICDTEPFRLLREFIARGMDEGEVRRQDVFVAAISFTGVVLRAVELRLAGLVKRPLTEAGEELIENAWASIRAPRDAIH